MKTKFSAPLFDIKSVSDEGVISGYGSVFGNRDLGGDVVVAGAFAKSIAAHSQNGTMPKMFWQHNPDKPIGKWLKAAEDGKGLYLEGRFNMGVQQGREALAHVKEGDIDGLSIGYSIVQGGPDEKTGAFLLKEVILREVSVVSIPMNEIARVESVKSERIERMDEFARRLRDGDPMPIKEFEDILRDAGVPRSMATAIASHGYAKAIRGEPEGEKSKDALALLMALRG